MAQQLRNDLIADIAETDGSKIFHQLWLVFLWHETYVYLIQSQGNVVPCEKIVDHTGQIVLDYRPVSLVEEGRHPI